MLKLKGGTLIVPIGSLLDDPPEHAAGETAPATNATFAQLVGRVISGESSALFGSPAEASSAAITWDVNQRPEARRRQSLR
jgi:hypothetical protein